MPFEENSLKFSSRIGVRIIDERKRDVPLSVMVTWILSGGRLMKVTESGLLMMERLTSMFICTLSFIEEITQKNPAMHRNSKNKRKLRKCEDVFTLSQFSFILLKFMPIRRIAELSFYLLFTGVSVAA
jgi:hypothetical protein